MLANVTVTGIFRPSDKKLAGLYDVFLVVCGSLFIGLSAQVAVQLPFSPVPVTGQTLAVLMTGVLLGRGRGSIAVIAYLIEGAAGLPVFAMGRAGAAILAGPTGGYLTGFIAAAYVTGLLAEKGWDRRAWTTVAAMILGNAALYVFGLSWLSFLSGFRQAVAMGLYPFVVGDVLKVVLAAVIMPVCWRLINIRPGSDNR